MSDIKNQYPDRDLILNIKQLDEKGNSIVGHNILLQKDGIIYDPAKEKDNLICQNNYIYAIYLKINGEKVDLDSIKTLRNKAADHIENNPISFSKAMKAQDWVQSYNPQEANSLLFRFAN